MEPPNMLPHDIAKVGTDRTFYLYPNISSRRKFPRPLAGVLNLKIDRMKCV